MTMTYFLLALAFYLISSVASAELATCPENDILNGSCTGSSDSFGDDVHNVSRIISIGAIVGIVVGAISTIVTLIILIVLWRRRQRIRQTHFSAPYYDAGFRPQPFAPDPYFAPPTHPPPSRSMNTAPHIDQPSYIPPSPNDGHPSPRVSSLHSNMAAYQSDLMARTRAQGIAVDHTEPAPAYHPY